MNSSSTSKSNKMRGGVRRRGKTGSWSYAIDLGLQPTHRCDDCNHRIWAGRERPERCPKCSGRMRNTRERRQLEVSGFATRQEAVAARNKRLSTMQEDAFVPPTRITVAEYLRDKWLPVLRAEGRLKGNTLAMYERLATHHIIGSEERPYLLGTMRLQKVGREAVRAHYEELAQRGRLDGTGKLSAATMRRIHATLSRAFNDAVERGWMTRNPVQGLAKHLPRDQRTEALERPMWTPQELQSFLRATQLHRLGPLWHLIVMTGLRRGEALAIRWEDIDLDRKQLRVIRSRTPVGSKVVESVPKTHHGRVVPLDDSTVAVLRQQAARQAGLMSRAGNRWHGGSFVFTGRDGRPLHPNRVYRDFKDAVAGVALPDMTIHGLRHMHITLGALAGVHPRVMQERAGHKTFAMTMDVYTHVPGEAAVAAANTIATFVNRKVSE